MTNPRHVKLSKCERKRKEDTKGDEVINRRVVARRPIAAPARNKEHEQFVVCHGSLYKIIKLMHTMGSILLCSN